MYYYVFQEAEEFERSWLLLADIYIQVCSLFRIMKEKKTANVVSEASSF